MRKQERMLSRRSFVRGACTLAGMGLLSGLAGCATNDVSVTQLKKLDDKRSIPPDDRSFMSDEPGLTARIAACDAFRMALPALQDAYSREHVNVHFVDPVYFPSDKMIEVVTNVPDGIDGVLTDMQAPIDQLIAQGLAVPSSHKPFYTARLQAVCSPDIAKQVAEGSVKPKDVQPDVIYIGNPDTVYSAEFANQLLCRKELYSASAGRGGTYAPEIANKVKVVNSVEDIANGVGKGEKAVGFVLQPEAVVYGLDELATPPRTNYFTTFYRGVALTKGKARMQAMDFITYCATKTEAEKVADRFGFKVS